MKLLIRAVAILALCVVLGLCLRTWGFGLTRIYGVSMKNTIEDGDVVLVTKFDYLFGGAPKFGDVVECRIGGRDGTYIKRVVGLPGDEVVFNANRLLLNGKEQFEDYVSSRTDDYSVTLGEDRYLLLGDNRTESYDSRMDDVGPLGRDAIIGRARLIVWPLSRFGIIG